MKKMLSSLIVILAIFSLNGVAFANTAVKSDTHKTNKTHHVMKKKKHKKHSSKKVKKQADKK